LTFSEPAKSNLGGTPESPACRETRFGGAETKASKQRLEDAKNWTRLLEAAGVKATVGPGSVLNRASMLIDVAIDGQGIALARTALTAWRQTRHRRVDHGNKTIDQVVAKAPLIPDSNRVSANPSLRFRETGFCRRGQKHRKSA
jgi:hypothetical protein